MDVVKTYLSLLWLEGRGGGTCDPAPKHTHTSSAVVCVLSVAALSERTSVDTQSGQYNAPSSKSPAGWEQTGLGLHTDPWGLAMGARRDFLAFFLSVLAEKPRAPPGGEGGEKAREGLTVEKRGRPQQRRQRRKGED
jgi:hypothetical protein